jgi:RHS repeat-associated protein
MESRQDGSILNEYLYVGGQRVARVANLGSIYYYYGDHLGTARLITNGGGTTCYDADYFPWGGEQNVYVPTCQQNYKFTGKERDPDMGVDYFGARFYSHSMARFYSPDPLLNSGRPGNPQNWNRYAYVLGNPLKFTDPTGLWDWAPNTCAASDKRCNKQYQNDQKKFRQGLKELKDARDSYKKGSKEYNRLDASLKAYGTENDGNNVTVGFGALPGSTAARATLSADEQGNLSFNVTFDPSKVGNAAPVDIGHEGTHVSDIDNPWYAGAGTLEPFQLEYRGYQTSSWVAQGLGVPTMTTAEGNVLWNPSWSAADREVMRDYGITNQVEDKDHPETQFHNPWPN